MNHQIRPAILMSTIAILMVACAAPDIKQSVRQDAIEVTDPSKVKPIAITKVVAKLRRGDVIGQIEGGWACIDQPGNLEWGSSSKIDFTTEELVDIFREELEAAGWPVVGSTDNLFEGYDYSGAELLVAAKIEDIETNICYPNSGFGDWSKGKGEMYVKTEWQLYSPARKEVINIFHTEGNSVVTTSTSGVAEDLLADAFAYSVRNLLADMQFLEAVSRIDQIARPFQGSRITISNVNYRANSVSDAIEYSKRATVTVRTSSAHGSGFAIGDGGKVLTNAHVVGHAQNVTIISSGGVSFPARVERISKERDVALIDLGNTRLIPLVLDLNPPNSGTEVYAVGSPILEEMSGTVTRGIISGMRQYDGLQWIQSDAAVNPGNSGGPLVSENGHVIGITTLGIGGQTGLNLFVPIEDALSFLSVDIVPQMTKR